MSSYRYRKSHCGDKTVVRSSYLHNGISYTGKMTSFYWIRALGVKGHGNNLCITGPLWGEATSHWRTTSGPLWAESARHRRTTSGPLCEGNPSGTGGFPSRGLLCWTLMLSLLSAWTCCWKKTLELWVIWDAMILMWIKQLLNKYWPVSPFTNMV